MLRFADICISNADDPSIVPLQAKVIVTEEPGLRMAPAVIRQLKLTEVVMPHVVVRGGMKMEETTLMAGLVSLQCDEHAIQVGVEECPSGIWLGQDLAEQLGIIVKPYQEKQGEVAHILRVNNAISQQDAQKVCAHANAQELIPIGEKYRTTLMAPLGAFEKHINRLLYEVATKHIEPFYNLQIEGWEVPQLMVYERGGIYGAHADGSYWKRDGDDDHGCWARFMDRDISVLLYLNDEFTGGELKFPDLDFSITPRAGMLVAFPSSHSYRHGAELTKSGQRIAIVSWMKAVGTPQEHNPRVFRIKRDDYERSVK